MDHILTTMILLPLIGVLWVVAAGQFKSISQSNMGVAIPFLTCISSSLIGLWIVNQVNASEGVAQFAESVDWISSYSIQYAVSVDGLASVFVTLISVVFPLCFIYEWSANRKLTGIHGFLLLLQSTLLGFVLAQDLFLVFFFLSMTSVPFYFMTAIWGNEEGKEASAYHFLAVSILGNALVFLAVVAAYYSLETPSFSLIDLAHGAASRRNVDFMGHSVSLGNVSFLLFLLGIAFRIPIWPFQGWFSVLLKTASTPLATVLIGAFIPVVVGMVGKLSFILYPAEMGHHAQVILVVGVLNVLMGSLLAISQQSIRTFLAAACIAELGLLLIGLSSVDAAAISGVMMQGLYTGLAFSGAAILFGIMVEQGGDDRIVEQSSAPRYGGLIAKTPVMGLFCALFFGSILGVPGLGGFVGQSLLLMGSLSVYPIAVVAVLFGLMALSYGFFNCYRLLFLGKLGHASQSVRELSWFERGFLAPLAGLLVVLGIYPQIFLERVTPTVLELLRSMGGS